MSSKKLCLAVSTYIQRKTLFPRRILTYSNFLGQTSVISPNSIKMLGVKINLCDIDVPSFSLAAKSDHIALWKSVYEGVKLFGGDRTFCLTEAGHVAGVVNPATSNKYSHMTSNSISDDPEKWLENATTHNGSWWNSWNKWLSSNSGNLVKAIDYNSLPIIEPAPGSYVK